MFANSASSVPVYMHREYANDLGDQSSGVSWVDQAKRVALVALPFLSLAPGVGRPLSMVMGSIRVVTSLQAFAVTVEKIAGGKEGTVRTRELWLEIPYHLVRVSVATIAVVACIFAHPIGMAITTGQDLVLGLWTFIEQVAEGDLERALETAAHLLNNALYLSVVLGSLCPFLGLGSSVTIASFVMQGLLSFYHSASHYQKGNYLEGTAQFLMGCIRGYQSASQIDWKAAATLGQIHWEEVSPNADRFVTPFDSEGQQVIRLAPRIDGVLRTEEEVWAVPITPLELAPAH